MAYIQLDLFTDYVTTEQEKGKQKQNIEHRKKLQTVTLSIKDRFGKNDVLKGIGFAEDATTRERNMPGVAKKMRLILPTLPKP